jgi:hypothetical protein
VNGDVTFVTLSESVTVFADAAAIAAVMAEPGTRRLWCAWILPAGGVEVQRAYLVEADQSRLSGVARRIADRVAMFDITARVEVFEPASALTPYTQGVLQHGRLLWVREHRPQLQIAWVLGTP